jgi:hypothetical protein
MSTVVVGLALALEKLDLPQSLLGRFLTGIGAKIAMRLFRFHPVLSFANFPDGHDGMTAVLQRKRTMA